MYCPKCGQNAVAGSKYCPNCGYELSTSLKPAVSHYKGSDTPLIVLKPKFIGWVTALSMLPVAIFFSIWGGGFFGIFSMFAIQMFYPGIPWWTTIVFFGLLFLILIPVIGYISKKKTYQKTEYRFYEDKLEYYEGFFNIEEKSVDYKNITEMQMRKGIVQRKYDLGTIVLATPATGIYTGGRTAMPLSGIRLLDVEDPDGTYTKIKALLGK